LQESAAWPQLAEWTPEHARWAELTNFIAAQGQTEWVDFTLDCHISSHVVAAMVDGEIAGFLRFVVQEIGSDEDRPSVELDGKPLLEAKVLAFGVAEQFRRRSIGRALQEEVLGRAAEMGCWQVRSHSSGTNVENHRLKLSMGFGVHPIVRGDDTQGVYFIMTLRRPGSSRKLP
jgi:GNAT superfamily N-acetyltransferase